MRIMVFFDLPVITKKQKKNYSAFRKFLIKDGYEMLQLSVYSRITRNHDDAKKHVNRLRNNLPPEGSVRVMVVTEKQYNSMEVLVGNITATEYFLSPRELIEV
jgi:CRISPR-associated protein Cas2